MDNFDVAFTAKGFALFVEVLTGKAPTNSVSVEDDKNDMEVDEIVAEYLASAPAPIKKEAPKRMLSEDTDVAKYSEAVVEFLSRRPGLAVPLKTISEYMTNIGFDNWTNKRASMKMKSVMKRCGNVKRHGYGQYFVPKETANV